MSRYGVKTIENGIKKASAVAHNVGVGMLALLLLLGAADVIGRYLLSMPITGAMEMSRLLLALMVLFGWGQTQILKQHVNLDMFHSRFPARIRAITTLATTIISLVFFGILAWQSAVTALLYYRSGRLVYTLEWPLAPIQLVVSLGVLMFCLVLVTDIIEVVREIRSPEKRT